MPSLRQTLEEARRALDRRDRAVASEMAQAYAQTWRRLQGQLQALLEDPDHDPLREARLHALIVQAETEFASWAQWASRRIANEFPDIAAAAEAHAAQLAEALAPSGEAAQIVADTWNRINHRALAEIVAITSPASPVMELFENLGTHAADTIASGLRAGVAQGWNPNKTARHIRDALGGDLGRALTVARTETMRAYREATRQSYLANSDIVTGWIWSAHPSTRTCAACWAMDGSHHKLDEELGSHPRCRCTMVPDLAPWGDIHPALEGMTELDHPTGAQRFAELSEAEQRTILGPTRYEAYKDGRLTLDDHPDTGVVQRRDDPVWGTTRTVRPIRDIPDAPRPTVVPAPPALVHPKDVIAGVSPGTMPKTYNAVTHTAEQIGTILRVPLGSTVPVIEAGSMPEGVQGSFSFARGGDRARDRIDVWRWTKEPHATFAHEFGHWLDCTRIGTGVGERFASALGVEDAATDALIAEWRRAVMHSPAVGDLLEARRLRPTRQLEYLLTEEELWARSFAQWVATKTGDPELLDGIRAGMRRTVPSQWTDAEFGPIAAAFDALFGHLGWLV